MPDTRLNTIHEINTIRQLTNVTVWIPIQAPYIIKTMTTSNPKTILFFLCITLVYTKHQFKIQLFFTNFTCKFYELILPYCKKIQISFIFKIKLRLLTIKIYL